EEQKALEERDTKLELLNDKILRESLGNPVRFGEKFQLFHIQSQSFVRPSKVLDEDDKTMIKLDLTKVGTKTVCFNFVPMLDFMQGEIVEYNVPLKVMSVSLDQPLS